MRGTLLASSTAALLAFHTPEDRAQAPKTAPEAHGHGAKDHDGAAIYAKYCALCHGDDRSGYAADEAPSLRSAELLGAASSGYLWTAISYGKPGTPMAAFAEDQGGPSPTPPSTRSWAGSSRAPGSSVSPSRTSPWWETPVAGGV